MTKKRSHNTPMIDIPKEERQNRFLAAFMEIGTLKGAAEQVPMNRANHYAWLKNDEEYAERFEEAKEVAADNLEAEAWERAYRGAKVEHWYQGEMVGYRRKDPSDLLIIFLLKGLRPEKYRDNWKGELSGPGGAQVEVTFGNTGTKEN